MAFSLSLEVFQMYLEMTDILGTLSQLPFFGGLLHISALSACSIQSNGQMD